VEHITREELKAKLDREEDFFLVDTMPNRYYRHSHLPGAVNLPADQVRERAPELLPAKDVEIVVYCIDPP
jgi:rhodanese-related sulfurtransferase